MSSITQTLRFEVIKPVNQTWDEVGTVLRAIQTPIHRVLNGIISSLELDKISGSTVHPQTMSYRHTNRLWDVEKQECLERSKKKVTDSNLSAIIASTHVHSNVRLGVAGAAYTKWKKWTKEKWKGTQSMPSFKAGSPIFVVGQGVKISSVDGNVVLSLSLSKDMPVHLIVKPYGPSGYAQLREVLTNPDCIGDVRLQRETGMGKKKWQAFMSFSREVKPVTGGRTMAIHRGIRNFLTVVIAGDDKKDAYGAILETGEDILKHKERYRARRRSLGHQNRQLGAGAKGHGVDRRYEHITRLEDSEKMWVDTKCKEIAAHAFSLGQRHGVTRILIEDWSNPASHGAPELGERLEYIVRSFPLAAIREKLEWNAKKYGWEVAIVATDNNSRTCPSCGHTHDTPPVEKGMFMCSSCSYERNVDTVFCMNMLARDGKHGTKEGLKKREKIAVNKLTSSAQL